MFNLDIEFDIDGSKTKTSQESFLELGEDFKAFHLAYAREVIEKEVKGGFPKNFLIRVDGRVGADPLDLKPFGKIEFINTSVDVGKLIRKAFDEILDRSPVGGPKGYFPNVKYKDWNWVLLNDVVVAKNRLQLTRFTENLSSLGQRGPNRITFINVVPYARKLERFGITKSVRGKSKGKTLGRDKPKRSKKTHVEIPTGTYAGSQRVIRELFRGKGRVSRVKYIPFNISVEGMRSSFVSTGRGPNQKPGRSYLYPVIDVIIDPSGFPGAS